MTTKLYIGNLPYSATEHDLHNAFAEHGSVQSFKLIMDRDTNQCKGFGFLEMSNSDEAMNIIQEFDGRDYQGRSMRVNEARPQEDRGGRGGNRGGFRGSNPSNRFGGSNYKSGGDRY